MAPLIESGGLLYGTTTEGGPTSYGGTAFKMNRDGSGFFVIKQFGPVPDIYSPTYGLLLASDGAFYGATSHGGPSDLLVGGGCLPSQPGRFGIFHSVSVQLIWR